MEANAIGVVQGQQAPQYGINQTDPVNMFGVLQ